MTLADRVVVMNRGIIEQIDAACNEVHVRSDWGSRAVDQIVGAVESWLAEDGVGSATLAIDDVAYTVVAP